jgi:vancomycin resistance protein YoaR
MKILIFLIVILLVACTEKDDNGAKKMSFEMMNKQLSVPIDVLQKEETLGEASTKIIDTGINRVSNITTACESISGMSLEIGEEFSFNKKTGARSKKNGYKYAPIIFKGEKSYGIGGGVCQVSSTIYMAAKNANLKITERHAHSEGVAYAPNGDDATVVFGEKDFRFKNTADDKIYIYTWIEDERVYAKIVKKVLYTENEKGFGN